MNNQKLWHEIFKPALLQLLKDKKLEYESRGYVPTLEKFIEDLEDKGVEEEVTEF